MRRRQQQQYLFRHVIHRRHFGTKYSGRVVPSSAGDSVHVVEVDPPTLPSDIRGYLIPRHDIICKATNILLQSSPATSPFLDLSEYLNTLPIPLTPSEASEILKSLKYPSLALEFFRFCPSHIPNFHHNSFTYNRILLILSKSSLPDKIPTVRSIVSDMERSLTRGSISTVNILIVIFTESSGELERCVGLVKKWGLLMNSYTYKCLMQAYLRSRDLGKAVEVYTEMRRRGYKLDNFGFNMLLDAVAKDEKQINRSTRHIKFLRT